MGAQFRLVICGLLLVAGCNRLQPVASPPSTPPSRAPSHPPDEVWKGAVVLGSPSLTAGIPGTGPLTLDQIRAWLTEPANHEPLRVALPLGLRSAEPPPIPPDNPLTRAKIELGRQLFFDRRLSRDSALGCLDCHHPQRNFTSDEIGHATLRETAVAFNRILSREQFWDGRAKSLEEQPRFPLENSHEMKTTAADCVAKIGGVPGYRLQFEAVFGKLDFESLCQAIAAFERTIVTGPSQWDYDVELRRLEALDPRTLTPDDEMLLSRIRTVAAEQPLSPSARRGAELFFSDRAGCSRCHFGPNFTDERFHDVGLRANNPAKTSTAAQELVDLGRFNVTGTDADRQAFKTPTLRNVALTWPYFHDGRYHELKQVVEHFVRGGDVRGTAVEPLDLTDNEIEDVVEYLRALTGALPKPETGRLP